MLSEGPLIYEPIIVTTNPVINRHGNVIAQDKRSFLPGLTAQNSIFGVLVIKSQIRINAGIKYAKIFTSSAVMEKSAASVPPPANKASEPCKKRRIYSTRASIYIPIILFLYYNKYIENNLILKGKNLLPFLILVLCLLAGILVVTSSSREKSGSWLKFFAKGKEAGFTMKDMEQLKQLAANCQIKDPLNIFKSKKEFETIIRSMVKALHLSGEYNVPATQLFLSRLFEYYHKIEMQSSENEVKITTSRQISEGQTLRILVAGTGVYKSEVVKNSNSYLAIARPVNTSTQNNMEWYGLRISVYFWREDDAGYVFDSEVVDEVFSKGISSLKIEHNDSLFRTQKRKSMRVKFQKPAFLYLLNEAENPHRLEKAAGLRVMLEDISDSGCAFKVLGQVTVGLRLKVQFGLDKIPICVPGTVRSVDYFRDTNTTIVHMEADNLPIGTRNYILCEVFNLLPEEDEDELPFRVLENEANAITGQADKKPAEQTEEHTMEAVNA